MDMYTYRHTRVLCTRLLSAARLGDRLRGKQFGKEDRNLQVQGSHADEHLEANVAGTIVA